MEVQDGFILSIFNYCDRWCQTCPFTSRCRAFADAAKVEAALDPNLRPVVEAAAHPGDVPPLLPASVRELIDEMNAAATEALEPGAPDDLEPELPEGHR